MLMKKNTAIFIIIFMCFMCLNTSCGRTNPSAEVNPATEPTPSLAQPPAVSTEEPEDKTTFSSMENAYYWKYMELAKTYGTYSMHDFYRMEGAHSYLGGVCVVSLMDFNRDGVQDLFIVYSNGKMHRITSDGYDLEVYDLPAKDTYEFEIWTYKNGELSQILHESNVSLCYTYPNNKSDFFLNYYQNFITVYENRDGFPVVQIYDESEEGRTYTNIYDKDGQIVRDRFTYNGDIIQMNGKEVTEDIWSDNVAGFSKIILCSLLTDSHRPSSVLLEAYNIDYNNTRLQTQRVIRYLSEEDKEPVAPCFYTKEGEYLSLYLQELERSNRIRQGPEFIENHYFNLYDMNQDDIPELILYEGSSGAGMHYHFYTIVDGELVYCGDYGRSGLLGNGAGGLIGYFGRMNGYQINKIVLEDHALSITEIASGHAEESYPELEELGYENYEYLRFCPPAIPFALYTYSQNLSN